MTTLRAPVHAEQSRLAPFEQAVGHYGRSLARSGAVWPILAIVALALASGVTWTHVPLISLTNSWAAPVDIGWGLRSSLLSYGALTVFIAFVCGVRTLAIGHWRLTWNAIDWRHDPRALRPVTLIKMGIAALCVSLLYTYQFIFVDFARVATQAKQESESLLIRHHLGYSLPAQTIRMAAFHDTTATMGGRLLLLVQLVSPGLLLPLFAGLLCFYGAYLLHRDGDAPARAVARPASGWEREQARFRRNRVFASWVALIALAVIALGRAPAALLMEWTGEQALHAGVYQNALHDFDWTERLNPEMSQLANFHQERGQALYLLHGTTDTDEQLYLADQDRRSGALDQAWLIDSLLYRLRPQDPNVVRDIALTAEMEMERSMAGVTLPTDPETERQNPQLATQSLGAPLMWADRLLAIQPNNLAGRYVHGRLLFAAAEYEAAISDFTTILIVSRDSDMQSAAYTYLAFCHAALGDVIGERALLRKAIQLDHGYNNTTAREAASGFH